ncbi:MAG: hypothetical protein MJE66_19015 [Proteobacteria bacterium]|nr:hypothetical protein [Pseudomonadota bacterium]
MRTPWNARGRRCEQRRPPSSAVAFFSRLARAGGLALALSAAPASAAPNESEGAASEAAASSMLRLELRLEGAELARLERQRGERPLDPEALQGDSPDSEFAKGTLHWGESSARVRVRASGPRAGGRADRRFEIRAREPVLGLRRFDLLAPAPRHPQAEDLVLAHLRREGVLAPRSFFVRLSLNGESLGPMRLEEGFSRRLLEGQGRPDGVIVRLEAESDAADRLGVSATENRADFYAADLIPYQPRRVRDSARLSDELGAARQLFAALVQGRLPAHRVLDVEATARFLAIAELWRSVDALRWHNLRFTLNPITRRLEPIGFGMVVPEVSLATGLMTRREPWSARLLEDPVLRSAFVGELSRIAADLVSGPARRWLRELEEPALAALSGAAHPFDLPPVLARAQELGPMAARDFAKVDPQARPDASVARAAVHAYLHSGQSGFDVEVVNGLPVPIRWVGVTPPSAGSTTPGLADELPLEIPAAAYLGPRASSRLGIAPEAAALGHRLRALVKLDGHDPVAVRVVPVANGPLPEAVPHTGLAAALAQHPFLTRGGERELVIAPGAWDVVGDLALPDGFGLRLEAGTTLRFESGGMLLATGPLVFRGDANAPIRLVPQAGARPRAWQGIAVLHSAEPHEWRYVEVQGASGPDRRGWKLDGGVTFRRSSVRIAHSRIEGASAEVALNFLRSEFQLEHVEVLDAAQDAVEVDSSEGRVSGGKIAGATGDGLDLNGSDVQVEGLRLEEIQDKALSVGERSRLRARDVSIRWAGTGVASKDGSIARLDGGRMRDVKHAALMAYVKKPEFGSAALEVEGMAFERVGRTAVAQVGSRVSLDGKPQPTEAVDVAELYTTGHMKE